MPAELKVQLQPSYQGGEVLLTLSTDSGQSGQAFYLQYDQLFTRVQELVNSKLQMMCNQVSLEAKQLRGK